MQYWNKACIVHWITYSYHTLLCGAGLVVNCGCQKVREGIRTRTKLEPFGELALPVSVFLPEQVAQRFSAAGSTLLGGWGLVIERRWRRVILDHGEDGGVQRRRDVRVCGSTVRNDQGWRGTRTYG